MRQGTVYTETVVHLAPERFAADVPYQVIIVSLDSHQGAEADRITARISGDRVAIGDRVIEIDSQNGIPFFQKS
jgi:uncharacterized OB-fold protein